MARPQETFNKKELQKKRLQKRKEKEQRREDRKANAKEGQSLEDMMAYVDEYGNITTTPPDPSKKKTTVKTEDIVIGSRNSEAHQISTLKKGKVTFFNTAKGFGFIKEEDTGNSVFVHINSVLEPIKENDNVTFETERGVKGMSAVRVKLTR